MRVVSFHIKNFRSIRELNVSDLKMVNIFLGKNNVGKTSVLEAIFLSLGPGNPQLVVSIDGLRNLIHNQADDFRFVFNDLNYSNKIEIQMNYDRDDVVRTMTISPNTQRVNSRIDYHDPKTFDQSSLTGSLSNSINDLSADSLIINFSIKKRHTKANNYTSRIQFENNNLQFQPTQGYKEELRGTIITGASTIFFNSLGPRLQTILINKQEDEIIKFLKLIDNSITGLTLGLNNIVLVDTGIGKRYPINLLGDGVVKIIAILLAIYDNPGGTVLIDEFSNGLHFTALRTLWKAIFTAASLNDVQVFVTSHDYEALTHLKYVLEEPEFVKFQKEVRSYTLKKNNKDGLTAYTYDFDQLEYAIEQEIEIR